MAEAGESIGYSFFASAIIANHCGDHTALNNFLSA
jgi:hypothetical protein